MAEAESTTTPETTAPAAEAPANDAATPEVANDTDAPEVEKKADPAKLLAALTRKKAKLRAEQAELARQRDELRTQSERAATIARESEQMKQLLARAREGDLDALEQLGVKYDDLTTRALRRNTPEEKIDLLQKQVEAERKAREEHEKKLSEREQQAAAEHAIRAFVGLVQGGEYPETALYPPQRIAEWGNQLADEMAAARRGQYPAMQEIAAELEKRIAQEHERIRAAKRAKEEAAAAAESAKGKKGPSPTISNRDAAERSEQPRELSEDEKRALFAKFARENLLR